LPAKGNFEVVIDYVGFAGLQVVAIEAQWDDIDAFRELLLLLDIARPTRGGEGSRPQSIAEGWESVNLLSVATRKGTPDKSNCDYSKPPE
jgi:hypothetical protein